MENNNNPEILFPKKSKRNLFGYVNQRKHWIVPDQFDEANDFIDGYAVVGKIKKPDKKIKYGLINHCGRIILAPKYDFVFPKFCEDLLLVQDNGKNGFLRGINVVIPLIYDNTKLFEFGNCPVCIGGRWGLISNKNKIIIPILYDNIGHLSCGLVPVCEKGLWHYVDKNNKKKIGFSFDEAENFYEGFAVIKLNGMYGYIDVSGKVVVKPRFADAYRFYKGRAIVKEEKKGRDYWFIDPNGNKIEKVLHFENIESYLESNESIDK